MLTMKKRIAEQIVAAVKGINAEAKKYSNLADQHKAALLKR